MAMILALRDADPRVADADGELAGRLPLHADRDFAPLGELEGITDQIHENLANPRRIAGDAIGNVRCGLPRQLETALLRLPRERLQRLPDHFADVERNRVDFESSGFDLGEVEDVVDDAQERFARLFDEPQALPLFGRRCRFEREPCHAEDAVHRGANLVAHIRDELALGLARAFGRFLRCLQLHFRSSSIRNVAIVHDQRADIRIVETIHHAELDVPPRRTGVLQPEDAAHRTAGGRHGLVEELPEMLAVVGVNEIRDHSVPIHTSC
jgi:hypothetical protein